MLVSIIIPTYNRANLIRRPLDSILNQTYLELEVIVVDDGSIDDTESLVATYAAKANFPVIYYKKENGGCSSARNKGIEIASGDCIAFLDSDDQLLPNAIESLVTTIASTGADFVYSPAIEAFKDGHEQVSPPAAAGLPALFAREHFMTANARPCSILYDKKIFDTLKFNEQLKYNEDSDFLQKVAICFKAAYSSFPTGKVFEHDSNKSGDRVAIYRALLLSSEKILGDYPDFASSLGELADIRICEIKLLLIDELIKKELFEEAKEIAVGVGGQLSLSLRLSLNLDSFIPYKIGQKVGQATSLLFCCFSMLWPNKSEAGFLKVLHVFHAYLHTTENWCYRLIKSLRGTQLYIVSEASLNEDSFNIPDAVFVLRPNIKWHLAPHPLVSKVMFLINGFLFVLWKSLVLYSARKADLIHAHFSFMGWNYLWLSEKTNTPLAISFYGFDYERLPNSEPVWKERYQELFEKASLFIAEGSFGRNKLIQMGCPEYKAKVVHLGVEVSNIPYYKRNKRPDELKLVQVATFVSKKGYDITIKAFIKALTKCPNMTLTLVGKDPENIRLSIEQEVRDHGLESCVTFIDGIDFSKLHVFLREYHVFIHPSKYGSYGDSEGGAPIVLLDAQASGMPILSTLHCDIPDEVINGETGILVEQDNYDALAEAIGIFYRMNELDYKAYCEKARQHIEKNYDAVKCAVELKRIYEECIA